MINVLNRIILIHGKIVVVLSKNRYGEYISNHSRNFSYLRLTHFPILFDNRNGLVDCETDYMKKIIGAGRSSKVTKVGEVMTDEVKINITYYIF